MRLMARGAVCLALLWLGGGLASAAPAVPLTMQGAQRLLGQVAAQAGLQSQVRGYLPRQMYEAIDGEADLFLAYGGRWLASADCKRGKAYLELELFDQGEPLGAYGVYGQLALGGRPVAAGREAVNLNDEAVYLWQSRYFLRVNAAGGDSVPAGELVRLAQAIARQLPGSSTLPAWTGALPARPGAGRPQYAARNALGYSFLSRVMTRDYPAGKGRVTLAVAQGADAKQAAATLGRLRTAYHGRPAPAAWGKLGREAFAGSAPGSRPARGLRSGRYLVILVGSAPEAQALGLASETVRRLPKAGGG